MSAAGSTRDKALLEQSGTPPSGTGRSGDGRHGANMLYWHDEVLQRPCRPGTSQPNGAANARP